MAARRMFSLKIINSAKFLKMPSSTQLLYFHLALNADDDGIVEGYNVIRMLGCSEDDLKVLVAKSYIIVLNEDLVSFITDWTEHNSIRPDRKIDSIYKDLLLQIPGIETVMKRQRADVKALPNMAMDSEWTTNGQPMVGIGKVRLGKVSLENNIVELDPIPYLEIVDYLNLKASTRYKATGNKTKDCIKARWNEKFILEDFKKVIDIKTKEWLKTEWEKFLRPETLFSNKFEGYLNQKTTGSKKEPSSNKEFGSAY